ncbi:MAG: TIGR04255 family protein, partial [Candidatus Thorarchaeota archaeon]
ERWEQFKDKLRNPLQVLIELYSIPHFSRIGLRYIDIIRRSKLGIPEEDWRKLLKPHLLGILGLEETSEMVTSFESKYEILLSDKRSTVRINTRFVRPVDGDEKCYVIDSDFYSTENTDVDSATERLDYFNQRASRLLRWCITDYLHNLMSPQEI